MLIAELAFSSVSSSLHKTKVVAVSVTQIPNNDIRCVYLGGTNDPELEYLEIIDPSGNRFWTVGSDGQLAPEGTGAYQKPHVGAVMTLIGVGTTGNKDHVIVAGHFSDGAIQILVENWV